MAMGSTSRNGAATRRGWRAAVTVTLLATAVAVGTATPAAAAPAAVLDALVGPASPGDLDVMTFNLRYASGDRPNSWMQRRPGCGNC